MNRDALQTRSMDLVNRFNTMADKEETGVVMNAIYILASYVLQGAETPVRMAFIESLLEVNQVVSEESNEANACH